MLLCPPSFDSSIVIGNVLDSKTCDNSLATVKYALRVLLEKDSKDMLPTYEEIYDRCYTVVGGARGQTLYDAMVMEFERCCRNLLKELMTSKTDMDSIAWLGHFAHVCVWFEGQVVRCFLSQPPPLSFFFLIAEFDFGGVRF